MPNESGGFRVNSAAKIFLGIALFKRLVLQHNLQATVRARSLMKKGLKQAIGIGDSYG
jgi:hypothetical protein